MATEDGGSRENKKLQIRTGGEGPSVSAEDGGGDNDEEKKTLERRWMCGAGRRPARTRGVEQSEEAGAEREAGGELRRGGRRHA